MRNVRVSSDEDTLGAALNRLELYCRSLSSRSRTGVLTSQSIQSRTGSIDSMKDRIENQNKDIVLDVNLEDFNELQDYWPRFVTLINNSKDKIRIKINTIESFLDSKMYYNGNTEDKRKLREKYLRLQERFTHNNIDIAFLDELRQVN
ncbi:hypothetical protein CL656_02580 [bacterium]|nr:hypothetical protein [bacterium]|tara:strand:+ start:867 stop:1310 length:444 start_codon:yes stop_codon:yes gene_type:complete